MVPSIKLVVRGFDKQSVVKTSEIVKIVNMLPKHHLAGLRSIAYIPPNVFSSMHLPIDLNCKGAYYPDFRSVILHDLVDRLKYKHILLHEIGHFVFHTVINDTLRKEWTRNISSTSKYVSEYAKKNSVEDFAESYATYVIDSQRLVKIGKKFQFMKSKVFSNTQY